tara:strand:+ start:3235 stop:3441 length:207 start_codon:yes stop_codon:yes gene_type:complete
MSEKTNKKEEIEKKPLTEVLGTMLQMQQYMQQATNFEAAKILHESGHCKDYIDTCPLCVEEPKKDEEE